MSVNRPGFSQSTKRASITTNNYNPGPGSYTTKDSFKLNIANERATEEETTKGIFYVVENGNL